GEALPGGEVGGVALQVGPVLLERHATQRRPASVRVAGRGPDVSDARHPRLQVRLVVLWAQRLQAEVSCDQRGGRLELEGNERGFGHRRTVSVRRPARDPPLRSPALSEREYRLAMRQIVVQESITLDGVIQAPGGPDEDPTQDFQYGGWTAPFGGSGDPRVSQFMSKVL